MAEPAPASSEKRFRFTDATDQALANVIALSGVHVAPHGEVTKMWEGTLNMFLATPELVAYIDERGVDALKWRTLQEHFKSMMTARKKRVSYLENATGITEEPTDYDETMDRLIIEMKDKEEAESKAKSEVAESKKRLLEAGKAIRHAALTRGSSSDDSSADGSPKSKKSKRGARGNCTTIAERELAVMELEAETNAKRVEVKAKRIEVELKKAEMQLKQNEAMIKAMMALAEKGGMSK